jgi:hypothetical protein
MIYEAAEIGGSKRPGYFRAIPVFLLFVALLSIEMTSFAQNRPKIVDVGEVKETPRKAATPRRPRLTPRVAPRVSEGLLIIQTDPDVAEVRIDGKTAGNAKDGIFLKEVAGGRQYSVEVDAGSEYEPLKSVVSVKPGGYAIIDAELSAKFAIVRIGPAKEGAKILVDGKAVPPENLRVDKESDTIIISRLLPGKHTIVYDHPDFAIVEREFNVAPGNQYTRYLTLERATVKLTVATDPGTMVFVDSKPVAATPADGRLVLDDIALGSHEIKLVKDGYEEYKETRQFEFQRPVAIDRKLVPIPTSAEFSDDFDVANAKRWTMPPSGWTINKDGRLYIDNSPALGFPKGVRYRDFVMTFHLRLGDSKGAAWALRARDAGSYYLFYLSGPDGIFKNRFNVYIVRDNRLDLSNHFLSVPVITELKAGGEYTISIRAVKNEIEHSITPASTGVKETLGYFKDPDSRYLIGGVGFRTVGPEKFSIDDLYVRPLADSTGN